MTTLETLKAARKVIEVPEHWRQGSYEGSRKGIRCYCVMGAIGVAIGKPPYMGGQAEATDFLEELWGDVANFNDNHTHPEVLRALDEAISKLEAA